MTNAFADDLDEGTESVLGKFVLNTKLGGAVDMLESRAAIQRKLDEL